ncbi:ATP-binding protein [Nocardioides nitrophenolicus]|uniref:ATP-binding protein n=1 Tax=Nocardioides nitrophenolicus TaxID=60489 RepID=UPI00195D6E54|nr:DUF4143 domain-containing protein [Nocardioides nitrophenolicus]MBM7518217.1 putative AAA+ superfamily ATPase [Nocardioides nitrophenolicus]
MTYLPRIADEALAAAIDTFPVVMLDGARAAGKTTSAARVVTSELRFPRDLAFVQADPGGVLADEIRPVLVDEWQLAGTELLWAAKSIVDADPAPGGFILAGSVEPEAYGPTYPLTGRSVRIALRPMTRRELEGGGAEPLWLERLLAGQVATPGRRHPRFDIGDLAITGFPAAARLAGSADWLRSYAGTIAERSVEDKRDPVRVNRLLRVLAECESQAVPDEYLWRSADINRVTLAAYEQMLTRTHIRADLPAWESNRIKRITTYPKRQYVDTALALALARIGPDQLRRDPALAGRFLESFVATQLRPECDRLGGVLHHVRTKGGEREVDLLIELDHGLVAVEVKAGVEPRPADARHLLWLREQLGDRLLATVVLHRGEATFELVDGVWAVPVTSLWT